MTGPVLNNRLVFTCSTEGTMEILFLLVATIGILYWLTHTSGSG